MPKLYVDFVDIFDPSVPSIGVILPPKIIKFQIDTNGQYASTIIDLELHWFTYYYYCSIEPGMELICDVSDKTPALTDYYEAELLVYEMIDTGYDDFRIYQINITDETGKIYKINQFQIGSHTQDFVNISAHQMLHISLNFMIYLQWILIIQHL